MNVRENYLRTVEFGCPEWIPCAVGLMPATWKKYREDLEDLVLRHPSIFGPYQKGARNFDEFGPAYREREYYTDNWGCVWYNIQGGLEGRIVNHPLENWSALATYKPPDSILWAERGPRGDWEKIQADIEVARAEGRLTWGGCDRFFERLHFLRGFKNLMIDFMMNPPQLPALIEMVLENNMKLIHKWLEIGVDVMGFGDDLGTQVSLMMSPAAFREYLKPGYQRMFGACRRANSHVRFHSDGHILEIVNDLIECGVTILNPQIRANTLDGIVRKCKGRVCIDLDLDRQLFPFCSPEEIKEHVKEAVVKLGSKEGGLMLFAECEPDVPLANIEAVCQAFEEHRFHYT